MLKNLMITELEEKTKTPLNQRLKFKLLKGKKVILLYQFTVICV
jgi:hypothetical protein